MFTISAFNKIFFKGRITLLTKNTITLLRPQKKVALFPEIGRVKTFLSFTRPHCWMCIWIFLISKNKQTSERKVRMQIKQKKLKKKREYLRKIDQKTICGGEDFSRHPHFRKQEYSFFWPDYTYHIPSQASTINLSSL